MGDGEEAGIAWILAPITLQRAEVIGITKLAAQFLEKTPIALRPASWLLSLTKRAMMYLMVLVAYWSSSALGPA